MGDYKNMKKFNNQQSKERHKIQEEKKEEYKVIIKKQLVRLCKIHLGKKVKP